MRKKAKRNPTAKPKTRKVNSALKVNRKPPATVKDKEELIRIWGEDLCE